MNSKKFITKKDWFGMVLTLGPALMITLFTILSILDTAPSSSKITQIIMITISIIFWSYVVLCWYFTYYILDENTLTARMAYFRYQKINIAEIEEMKKQEFGKGVLGLSKDILSIKLLNDTILNISPLDIDGLVIEINLRKSQILSQ
jgi:hypothetical protein